MEATSKAVGCDESFAGYTLGFCLSVVAPDTVDGPVVLGTFPRVSVSNRAMERDCVGGIDDPVFRFCADGILSSRMPHRSTVGSSET